MTNDGRQAACARWRDMRVHRAAHASCAKSCALELFQTSMKRRCFRGRGRHSIPAQTRRKKSLSVRRRRGGEERREWEGRRSVMHCCECAGRGLRDSQPLGLGAYFKQLCTRELENRPSPGRLLTSGVRKGVTHRRVSKSLAYYVSTFAVPLLAIAG